MGDISDMVLEGWLCQCCGCEIESDMPSGVPSFCYACTETQTTREPVKPCINELQENKLRRLINRRVQAEVANTDQRAIHIARHNLSMFIKELTK